MLLGEVYCYSFYMCNLCFTPGAEEAPDRVSETQPPGTAKIAFADHQYEKVGQSRCMFLLHMSIPRRYYLCVFTSSQSPVQLDCPTQQHVRKSSVWWREGGRNPKQEPRPARPTTHVEVMNHEI